MRATARRQPISAAQLLRELPAPGFGAFGTITIQESDAKRRDGGTRGKQLADRSLVGLFIGVTPNHKCIMLLRDKTIMLTSDVHFAAPANLPGTNSSVPGDSTDEWMALFDSALPPSPTMPTDPGATSDQHAPGLDAPPPAGGTP